MTDKLREAAQQVVGVIDNPPDDLHRLLEAVAPALRALSSALAEEPQSTKKENTMEAVQDMLNPYDWRVENILEDGAAEITIFCGPNAETRAKEYAASREVRP